MLTILRWRGVLVALALGTLLFAVVELASGLGHLTGDGLWYLGTVGWTLCACTVLIASSSLARVDPGQRVGKTGNDVRRLVVIGVGMVAITIGSSFVPTMEVFGPFHNWFYLWFVVGFTVIAAQISLSAVADFPLTHEARSVLLLGGSGIALAAVSYVFLILKVTSSTPLVVSYAIGAAGLALIATAVLAAASKQLAAPNYLTVLGVGCLILVAGAVLKCVWLEAPANAWIYRAGRVVTGAGYLLFALTAAHAVGRVRNPSGSVHLPDAPLLDR